MSFPHKNPLPKPLAVTTPSFDELLASVKAKVLDYLAENNPEDVDAIAETFENNAELLTKFVQAFTVIIQGYFRQANAQALQMFGMYATDDEMVDLIASRLGVTRQVIDEGDPNAYPVVPPTMESNEDLLTRYYLAAFALATTGTRSGYRFHAMTLGGRPKVTIESPSEKKVVVTYDFESHEMAGRTKDAQARRVAPGEVDCFILAHADDGQPSSDLINATQEYMERDDIAQETDLLTVKAPTIVRWSHESVIYLRPGPDSSVVKEAAEAAVLKYAKEQHMLAGSIEPSLLYGVLVSASSATRVDVISPAEPIRCNHGEAPYIDSINITIVTESV